MSKWAIVAIPQEDDPVWKYSSEKVPHMTLLFLGEQTLGPEAAHIFDFLSHVASTTMFPFGMHVDRRGVLGEDEADVLFFNKDKHGRAMISQARNFMLADAVISKMYNSTEQYPEWSPHLTMGYPETPAVKDDREYPGINYVQFDKVALWIDDYAGPEFRLEGTEFELSDMSMADEVGNFLQHFGIKGMRWGRRKAATSSDPLEVTFQAAPGGRVKTQGGHNQPASEDAIRVAKLKQQAKASTTDSLSNDQMRDVLNRMNMEQQYANLTSQEAIRNQHPAKKFIKSLLGDAETLADQQAKQVVNYKVKTELQKSNLLPADKKKGN